MKTTLLTTLLLATPVAPVLAAEGAPGHRHDRGEHALPLGEPGDPGLPSRSVEIVMSDDATGTMAYSIKHLDVVEGEQVRFVVRNDGALEHELVLGTPEENAEHYELMMRFPEMEHDDPNMIRLGPGERGELVWKFSFSGRFEFACLHPGHYEAGMRGDLVVAGEHGH